MMSHSILTITLNPAVDVSSNAEVVRPVHKIRTTGDNFDPGGGGINVARVVSELGGNVEAIYIAGGPSGDLLEDLLKRKKLAHIRIPASGNTRLSFNVFERATGLEYRFVPEGPEITSAELDACLDRVRATKADYIVASGSVPRGAPDDIMVELGNIAQKKGAKYIIDTSGTALAKAVHDADVHLVKPSLHELSEISGQECDERSARKVAAELIAGGKCKMIAVTLGAQGATLVTKQGAIHRPASHVTTKSAVGAGDSFLGGMVWALAEGWGVDEAFRLGLAAGAAAAMTPGTELCYRDDVFDLFDRPQD